MIIGDIVRFTRFFWDSGGPNEACPPIWGRVSKINGGGGGEFTYLCGGSESVIEAGIAEEVVFYIPDKWEVVPEDQVPDEIWPEVAKIALIGRAP